MKSRLQRSNIYVKKSSIQGFGVFAEENIPSDAVIEECCTLRCKETYLDFINIYFKNTTTNEHAIPLGYGSIYNHSDDPNADYVFDPIESVMVFRSIKPIKKGEEIFIYYGPNWFQKRGMKRIERFRIRSFKSFFYFLLRFAIITSVIFGFIAFLK